MISMEESPYQIPLALPQLAGGGAGGYLKEIALLRKTGRTEKLKRHAEVRENTALFRLWAQRDRSQRLSTRWGRVFWLYSIGLSGFGRVCSIVFAAIGDWFKLARVPGRSLTAVIARYCSDGKAPKGCDRR